MKEWKLCRVCFVTKTPEAFNARPDGSLRRSCRKCEISKKWRERTYCTKEQYESLMEKQDGKCAMCSHTDPQTNNDRFLADYDQETHEVRALLCNKCSRLLISMGHSPKKMGAFLAYYEKYDGR